MDLEKLLTLAEKRARSIIFKSRRQQVPPTWILADDNQRIWMIATPWDNEAERQIAKLLLAQLVQERHITAYGFVSEVWRTSHKIEEAGKPILQPRKDPNREEMIFSFATDGKSLQQRGWGIVRDWNEKVIKLEAKGEVGAAFGGWIVSLLGTPTSP